jgi:hypothetical protein
MASPDELRALAKEAAEAGDAELLTALVDAINQSIPAPQPPAQEIGGAESFLRGVGQGVTFGFGDEAAAALSSGAQWLGSDRPYGELYEESKGRIRGDVSAAERANPGLFLTGEISGSMGGGPGMLAAKAVGTGGRVIPRLAGVGAGEGALYGTGLSEGETAGDVAMDAAQGAALGAVLAPVGAKVAEGVGKVGMGVYNAIRRKVMSSPKDVADRAVRKALADDSITGEEAMRLVDEHPDLTLADMGPNLEQLAVGAGNTPGGGSRIATGALTGRQYGQQARIEAAAREGVGDKWGDYYDFLDNIVAQRKAQSAPLYDEAYKVAIQDTPGLAEISRMPSFQAAAKRAQKNLGDELGLGGGVGLGPEGMRSTRFMDLIKRELDDMIGTEIRGGNNNRARQLQGIKNQFVSELDAQNPAYKAARETFAGASQLKDAAELGKSVFIGNKEPRLIQRAMKDMSEGELESFRVGVLDSLISRVQMAGGTHNSVKRLVNSTRAKDLIRQVFPDEVSFNKFMDTLDAESAMTGTFQAVTQGSRTAPMLMQKDALEDALSMGGSIASDIATQGGPGVATGATIAKKLFGETLGEAEYEEIAKLLFGHLDEPARKRLFGRMTGMKASEVPEYVGRLTAAPASQAAGALSDG